MESGLGLDGNFYGLRAIETNDAAVAAVLEILFVSFINISNYSLEVGNAAYICALP